MNIYVRKQEEVKVEACEEPDLHGSVRVTEDGVTRVLTAEEFEQRYESKTINEWPGRIAQADSYGYQPGCKAVSVTADDPEALAVAMNAWATDPANATLIIRERETFAWHDQLGKQHFSCLFLVSTETSERHRAFLDRLHNKITEELKAEDAKMLQQQQDALKKAKELGALAKEAEKARIKELEAKALIADRCVANHKKEKRK